MLVGSWKAVESHVEVQLRRFQRRPYQQLGWRVLFDILAKDVAVFCLVLRNSPKTNLKSNGLTSLVEEILRQPNIDCCLGISNHSYACLC